MFLLMFLILNEKEREKENVKIGVITPVPATIGLKIGFLCNICV